MAPDPALFRLRAFERDWVAPLRREFDARAAARRSFSFARRPHSILDIALLMEAERWIEIGQELGYFARAEEASPERPWDDELQRFREQLGYILEPREEIPDHITAAEFGLALEEAIEDLTPERREYLALIHFAGDELWRARLDEVRELGDAFRRRPDLSLPSYRVDRIAWSLDGPISEMRLTLATLPARWRHFVGSHPDEGVAARSNARSEELDAARRVIQAAAELAGDDPMAARLRGSARESRLADA